MAVRTYFIIPTVFTVQWRGRAGSTDHVRSLAVAEFDLVYCSLSVLCLCP